MPNLTTLGIICLISFNFEYGFQEQKYPKVRFLYIYKMVDFRIPAFVPAS
jgi:hypothetical protein